MNAISHSTTSDTSSASASASASDAEPRGSVVDVVFDLATTWAQHGLTVGKLALEASATTLQETAKLLGSIRTTLDRAAPAAQAK